MKHKFKLNPFLFIYQSINIIILNGETTPIKSFAFQAFIAIGWNEI
jgi:hypothetical protein